MDEILPFKSTHYYANSRGNHDIKAVKTGAILQKQF